MSREIMECRKCKKFINVWHGTDIHKKQLNICDECDIEESERNIDKIYISALKKKVYDLVKTHQPRRCCRCNIQFEPDIDSPLDPYHSYPYESCEECQSSEVSLDGEISIPLTYHKISHTDLKELLDY